MSHNVSFDSVRFWAIIKALLSDDVWERLLLGQPSAEQKLSGNPVGIFMDCRREQFHQEPPSLAKAPKKYSAVAAFQ